MSKGIHQSGKTRVVACRACQAPVVQSAATCPSCGAVVSGSEQPYILRRQSSPDIVGMIKWWAIWSLAIWALAGFSFGVTSSLLFTGVTFVYLFRIVRAYYA